jgi:putative aldouronate transport system substrate-binding protein
MRKYRKLLAFLAISMLVLSLGACTTTAAPTSAPPTTAPTTEPTSEPTVPKDAETGLTPMEDTTPITFTQFIRDPETEAASSNPVLKKITELTGVTIDFEFLVGDLDQKIGVMTAGEDYPDIIFAGDANAKFIDAGAFIPLEDKLPNYKNLNDLYSPHYAEMKSADGHAYILCIYNAYGKQNTDPPQFNNGGSGFFIQKAVIEDAGYKVPKTIDEYFGMIEAYKAKYPTIDGVATIGFEILCDGWRDFCLCNPPQHLLGASNDGDAYVDLTTYKSSAYQITDTAKAYYKKLNEEYKKGIIQAETFTQNYDQYISRLSTGVVLGMFDQAWDFGTATNKLNSDNKQNRTYVSVPIANPGVQDSYLDGPNYQFINGIGITVDCKNPDRLLAFYDWLIQRDVQDYLNWGIEGTDYTVVKDGADKVLTAERRAINQDTAQRRDLTGYNLSNYSPKMQGLYLDGNPCNPLASAEEFKTGLKEYDQNFLKALNVDYFTGIMSPPVLRPAYYPVWGFTIEDGSAAKTANTAFRAEMAKHLPQVIMAADDAAFESKWDAYVAAFNATDPQAYFDEVDKQIAAKMAEAK